MERTTTLNGVTVTEKQLREALVRLEKEAVEAAAPKVGEVVRFDYAPGVERLVIDVQRCRDLAESALSSNGVIHLGPDGHIGWDSKRTKAISKRPFKGFL